MYKADGFDEAIIGLTRIAGRDDVIAYDYWKCIDILMTRDGMSAEDAVEYMEFNVISAYVGEFTPAFIYETDISDWLWEHINDNGKPEQFSEDGSGDDN